MRLNVFLNKQHVREDGTCRVGMYVTLRGRGRHMFEFYLKPKDWDDRLRRVRPGHLQHMEYNRTIADAVNRAEVMGQEVGITAAEIVRRLGAPRPVSGNFYKLAKERQIALGKKIAYNTRRQRLSVLRIIERIKPGLTLEEFTPDVIEGIEIALLNDGASTNNIAAKLQKLRTMWLDLAGENVPSPWKKVDIKVVPTTKKGLFPEQMEKVIGVDLSLMGKPVQMHRHAFVMMYLFCGMRWGDFCRAHTGYFNTPGMLIYQMHKTDKIIQWPLHPLAAELMKLYSGIEVEGGRLLMPFLREQDLVSEEATDRRIDYMGKEVNKSLKVVSTLTGLPPLSCHWARHSNAVKAKLSGVDNKSLQDMMGHSASRTTDEYVKLLTGTMHFDAYKKMHG